MTASATLNYGDSPTPRPAPRPRIWPGVAIVILQWLIIKIPAYLWPQTMAHFMCMFWGPIAGFVAILIWWLGFSRFPWPVRRLGLIPLLLEPVLGFVAAHPSMRMGMSVIALPVATSVFVGWVVIAEYLLRGKMLRAGLVIAPLLAWGFFTLLRMDGLTGSIHAETSWRFGPTAEEKFLAKIAKDPSLAGKMSSATKPSELTLSPGDWPAFRGPNRDGKLTGVTLTQTDWTNHPPKLAWKHLIGPGWGSFSVIGNHVFTQEQRGPVEMVSCYDLNTGDEIWAHDNAERFEETMGGVGPRATPTFADGKLYTLGATGRLNCLNPATGKVIWSRKVTDDTGAAVPMWGFSASPLVNDGSVIVMTGGKGKSVIAYDQTTGNPQWSAGDGWSYASIQKSKIDGVEQLLAVTNGGMYALDPHTGHILWQHDFSIGGGNRVIQPAILNGNDLLLGAAFGYGTRKIHVTHTGNTWKNQTVWTTKSIQPYYNDLVIHKGNIYGFDGDVFCCINPDTGQSRWRQRGFGNGQVLLIADQGLLLILSEQGEVALAEANPDGYHELGRFQAVNGKTWNHPVIAHGKLLVRNGEDIACYEVK
ncbi:MAG TPA: PQQ-binding-like beta-propeller repeat protein [Tepidisphaeraceae bacterium]|jgi:outer membrane protein assembly factor BamB|nr:PQQ-binding-like beta-propeller repeat protein [Tepidisphaeraceae bacterium]